MIKLTSKYSIYIGYIIVIGLILINVNNEFFWDTIQLGSKHATFFYNTNFSEFLLPNEMDSGHIPTFGAYIALIWKTFGRNLISSHLAMLPFAIGIVYQLNLLCKKFINENYTGFALILILIDPTLMSQITLVSPDVALVFFFLLGLNSVINNRKYLLCLSIVLLFLTSMRGMMISIALLITDLYLNIVFTKGFKQNFISLFRRSLIYLPAFSIFLVFSTIHYLEKGWIGYHKDSPWAKCFESTNFKGFLLNIGYYGWRILDFGRVGIWLVFFILLIKYKQLIFKNKKTINLSLFFLLIAFLLPLNMLWAKNLLGHRYFLPVYIVFSLLTATILFSDFVSNRFKIILSTTWIIVLLSGNFWIYPQKIAKGWDSTLAHLPYYELKKEAVTYLDKNNINFTDVDSFFPNTSSFDENKLNNDHRIFETYQSNNNSKFVFYSNIFNINDETIKDLDTKYIPIQRFEKRGVYIIIYKLKTSI